ncbi:MAG: DoxX family protein [Saprospiraceae bacterium]|nr:DoxX family protein [Saprospiraceae bacterium]
MEELKMLLHTHKHVTGFITRLTLATVILPHGCQMMLGWFNGPGFSNAMNYLTQVENLPWLVGFTVILLQFVGALAILAGFASRLMAFGTIFMFLGMILTSHVQHGFFMNWMGDQKGEGFEYHLLVIGLSLVLMVAGAGQWSVDRLLTRKWHLKSTSANMPNAFA